MSKLTHVRPGGREPYVRERIGSEMRITFQYDAAKAAQAVLWLLHHSGGAMDKMKLVKLIFFADRLHLAHYGRPIVGGRYVAMQHGPVSSNFLDHINGEPGTPDRPFALEGHRVRALADVDDDVLSESDAEVLRDVLDTYGGHDTFRLRDLTHGLRAWRENYPKGDVNTSVDLSYEDFFLDLPDQDMLDIIREDQETGAFFE